MESSGCPDPCSSCCSPGFHVSTTLAICAMPFNNMRCVFSVLFSDETSRKHVSVQGQFPQVILGDEGKLEETPWTFQRTRSPMCSILPCSGTAMRRIVFPFVERGAFFECRNSISPLSLGLLLDIPGTSAPSELVLGMVTHENLACLLDPEVAEMAIFLKQKSRRARAQKLINHATEPSTFHVTRHITWLVVMNETWIFSN